MCVDVAHGPLSSWWAVRAQCQAWARVFIGWCRGLWHVSVWSSQGPKGLGGGGRCDTAPRLGLYF